MPHPFMDEGEVYLGVRLMVVYVKWEVFVHSETPGIQTLLDHFGDLCYNTDVSGKAHWPPTGNPLEAPCRTVDNPSGLPMAELIRGPMGDSWVTH